MVFALHCFLAAAPDGSVNVAYVNSRMGGKGGGVLVPLSSSIHCKVDDIGLLEFVCASGFDPVTSLISYSQSAEVDCTPGRTSPTVVFLAVFLAASSRRF